tara:strand:- start:782 stop:976 length:195 start_codon:yes stop_codon:yes gene_type:complete
MDEVRIVVDGITYSAEYDIFDDTLVVYLPDGTTESTELKGLRPDAAARPHLLSYVKKKLKRSAD